MILSGSKFLSNPRGLSSASLRFFASPPTAIFRFSPIFLLLFSFLFFSNSSIIRIFAFLCVASNSNFSFLPNLFAAFFLSVLLKLLYHPHLCVSLRRLQQQFFVSPQSFCCFFPFCSSQTPLSSASLRFFASPPTAIFRFSPIFLLLFSFLFFSN